MPEAVSQADDFRDGFDESAACGFSEFTPEARWDFWWKLQAQSSSAEHSFASASTPAGCASGLVRRSPLIPCHFPGLPAGFGGFGQMFTNGMHRCPTRTCFGAQARLRAGPCVAALRRSACGLCTPHQRGWADKRPSRICIVRSGRTRNCGKSDETSSPTQPDGRLNRGHGAFHARRRGRFRRGAGISRPGNFR